jgi:predicted DNA-binding helix-hairpin-helix protein
LADRVSVNLDTPNAERMACVEPSKDWETDVAGTLVRARRISEEVKEATEKAADVTTALVVGASGETDCEILRAMGRCYDEWDVRRVHFGRFQPVGGTSMECFDETPPVRVRRLYETDFLVRRYGFALGEFETQADGNLDPDTDPKVAVARRHPDLFPVEVTTAPREMLLRVPGIGELSVRRILRARDEGAVRDVEDLHAMGVVMRRAAPFLTVRGRMPVLMPPSPAKARASRRGEGQLSLF